MSATQQLRAALADVARDNRDVIEPAELASDFLRGTLEQLAPLLVEGMQSGDALIRQQLVKASMIACATCVQALTEAICSAAVGMAEVRYQQQQSRKPKLIRRAD